MFSFFRRNKPKFAPVVIYRGDCATPKVWSSARDYCGALPLGADNMAAYTYASLTPALYHCRIGKIVMK